MNTLDINQVVKSIRDLPALPSIVMDLISSFEREDVDVTTLAEKMSRDQAMAAKTLRLANSSFYGLPAKVKTVKQAIVVLGFDSARALAVASSVIDSLDAGGSRHIDVAGFWRHSIAAALCAKSLARHAHIDQDHAFIAGLLHDIGRLVLASRFPDQYAGVIEDSAGRDSTLAEAEVRLLGVDHQRVGQMLAENWKFPPLIQRAIGTHHAPASADLGDVPGVVHVANAMVHALDLGGGEHVAVPHVHDVAIDSLRLTPAHLYAVCRETETQFEEACRLLM
jgi:putative nucleotidyltransferase with HDIG domain